MYFQSHDDDTTLSKDDNMRLNPNWESPNAPSINGETMYAGTGIGPGQPRSSSMDMGTMTTPSRPTGNYGDFRGIFYRIDYIW